MLARERDLELDSWLIVDLPESGDPFFQFEQGCKLSEELQHRRPFTALMAFEDMTAFGAIRVLFHPGIRVPDQCSVVGFDDVSPAAIYSPGLTTCASPWKLWAPPQPPLCSRPSTPLTKRNRSTPFIAESFSELMVRDSNRSVK
jgi:Periplasmic binding protein-like domain